MLHSTNINTPPAIKLSHKAWECFDGVVSFLSTSSNFLPLEEDILT